MTNEIKINSQVRILYGEHAGKHAQVVGIAECGHQSHDQIALLLPTATAPVFLFRFALDYVSDPALVRVTRICRFGLGNAVIVISTARSQYLQRGRILRVYNALVSTMDGVGRSDGPFHASYDVQFVWNGFDAPHDATTVRMYDWELTLASEQ